MLAFLRPDLSQFNSYTPHPEAERGEQEGPVDRLDTNEYPVDLPADLKRKLAYFYQNEIETNRYPDGAHAALKAAIAEYVNESATTPTHIGPDHISVGNGSDELIRSLLISTCLGNQGSVLVANPTFSMYGILAHTLGIPVVQIQRTDTFALHLQEAKAALVQSILCSVRVVFMVHPNSPTGNPLTTAEIEWLRQLPPHILVVIDEAYFEFSGQTLVGELAHHPNWAILRTFSKAFRLATHRIGYAIAHPDFIQVLEKVRLPYNLPAMTQAAAQLALAHRQVLLQDIPALIQERERVYTHLSQNKHLRLWPSSANFIYAQTDALMTATDLSQKLKQFGTSIRLTGGGLRITIGTPDENNHTIQRIQQILGD